MSDGEVEMSTEQSGKVPEGIDPDESPFELQAIEGLPFGKNSAEALAIREVLAGIDGGGAAASPWHVPPVEGLPFDKNSDEARAIERVIEHAKQQETTASEREEKDEAEEEEEDHPPDA